MQLWLLQVLNQKIEAKMFLLVAEEACLRLLPFLQIPKHNLFSIRVSSDSLSKGAYLGTTPKRWNFDLANHLYQIVTNSEHVHYNWRCDPIVCFWKPYRPSNICSLQTMVCHNYDSIQYLMYQQSNIQLKKVCSKYLHYFGG